MKKIRIIAAILAISLLTLTCGCLCFGCWDFGRQNSEDTENTENDLPAVEKPQQEKLSTAINATLWTDGIRRFEFNDDGSTTVYMIDSDYRITESKAAFDWKYKDELLYFCNAENEELVKIEAANEKIISQNFDLEIARSDAVFASATVISARNSAEEQAVIYENGAFMFFDNYKFYADEAATLEAISPTPSLYAFPNDILSINVSFDAEGYDEIRVHNYMSDDYITKHDIILPDMSNEDFFGWFFKDIEFDSITDIIDYATENSVYEIKLSAKYEVVDEHVKFVMGEYVYTNRKGEQFTITIAKNRLNIYDDSQELLGCFEWQYSDEDGYKIVKDILSDTEIISAYFEPDDNCDIITIDCKEIRTVFGDRLGNILIERI